MAGEAQGEGSVRAAYEAWGVEEFYRQYGAVYRNPHEEAIAAILAQALLSVPDGDWLVLDLACGSGEVTLALRQLGWMRVEGLDPYTYQAYQERTGQPARRYRFEEIEQGALLGCHYGLIVCSFALHLVASSRLPRLAYQLSLVGDRFLVISPHKRPLLLPQWGWHLVEELYQQRVRSRLYLSTSHFPEIKNGLIK